MSPWGSGVEVERRNTRTSRQTAICASFLLRGLACGQPCPSNAHVRRITTTCIVETPAIPQTRLRVICTGPNTIEIARCRGWRGRRKSPGHSADMQSIADGPDDDHEAWGSGSMAFLRPLPRLFHMSPRAATRGGTHTAVVVVLSLRDCYSL
jgi:hypothetical protein